MLAYKDPQRTVRDELRQRHPRIAERALQRKRAAAVKLFCYECMGGSSREANRCQSRDCFLWNCITYRVNLAAKCSE